MITRDDPIDAEDTRSQPLQCHFGSDRRHDGNLSRSNLKRRGEAALFRSTCCLTSACSRRATHGSGFAALVVSRPQLTQSVRPNIMEASVAEVRANMIQTYAGWTALSALRSGAPIKDRAAIYPLLKAVPFRDVLGSDHPAITALEFDAWHAASTKLLCEREPRLTAGWATKLLNVYLKTAAYVGDLGRPGLRDQLHPPIDTGLWTGLGQRFPGSPILEKTHVVTRIKNIHDYPTYLTIITGCREAALQLDCRLIEVDQLWKGADASA